MATNFDYKVRNPEMKELLVEMGGVINALEDGAVAASGAPVVPVASTVDLTLVVLPTVDEDSITLSQGTVTETYTFVTTPVDDFDVAVGADASESQANLVTAIGTHSALVTIAAFDADVAVLTAKVKGVIGDTISSVAVLTEETDGFDAETLAGGVDGTVGLDGQLRYAADKIYISVGASTTAASNWKYASLS